MLVNTPTNYNINHYGYLKEHRILQHNLKKARFKFENLNTAETQKAFKEAQYSLNEFLDNNIVKHFFYSIPNIIKRFFTTFRQNRILSLDTANATNIFNQLEFEYEGKKSNYTNFKKQILEEKNIQKKEEMNALLKNRLNKMQDLVKALVRTRNNFAQKKGYPNYYEYQLENEYGTSSAEIDEIIDKYYRDNNVFAALRQKEEILALKNNLEASELTESHKKTPLYTYSGINEYINNPEQVIEHIQKSYSSMGYDIQSLEKEGKIIFDLSVNNKKTNRTYCQCFTPGESVGICASTYGDINSLYELTHEIGHGIHFLNAFKWLPKNLKIHNPHISEAVAIMFETLIHKENQLNDITPKKVVNEFNTYKKLDEISEFARLATYTQFEKELYKNPEQNLEELFSKLEEKYYGTKQGREWLVHHFITAAGYMQNYIRAFVIAEKIYNSARKNLGTELSSNPKTANFLNKRIFGFGGLVNDKTLDILLNL